MDRDGYDWQTPLIECPQYNVLHADLVFLRDEVEKDIKRLPSQPRLLNADCSSNKSLLSTDWQFAMVSIPCWVGHALGVRDEIRQRSLAGGYYVYHHLLALDRLIDTDQAQSYPRKPQTGDAVVPGGKAPFLALDIAAALPVATSLAIRQFQHILESDSEFWEDFERAYTTWAETMYWERGIKSYSDVSLEHGMRMESGKCAPFCISSIAVCRAGGHDDRIADVERAITTTNIAMDLADDYSDWASDLKEGRFNSFIALAASYGLLESDIPTFDEMLSAILHTSLLDLYVDQVCTLTAQTEQMAASIGAAFWLPLLTDLRCYAMKQRDAFRTGFSSLSNLLFKGE